MARQLYYVVLAGHRWNIRHGQKVTSYPTRLEAIAAALGMAQKVGRKGNVPKVLEQGANGRWYPTGDRLT